MIKNKLLSQFIGHSVVNKLGDKGVIETIDDEHVKVKYQEEDKTYNTHLTFTNGYLRFEDPSLKQKMDELLNEKAKQEEEKNQKIISIHKEAVKRNRFIQEEYERLYYKAAALSQLFGPDFIYPPFVEFLEKYRGIYTDRVTILDRLFYESGRYDKYR